MLLIVGSGGLLGMEFRERLSLEGAYFATSSDIDITEIETIRRYVKNKNIHTIINCAAARDAEALEDNPGLANHINVFGAGNLALVSREIGASIIHFSSDYVFDGRKSTPYAEDDEASPLSVYGQSKFQGEGEVLSKAETALIIRTSWLFSSYGKDFVKIIRKVAGQKPEIGVVFDQVGSPCYAGDLAEAVLHMAPQIKSGMRTIYHLSNQGICSWYDLAFLVVKSFGLPCYVKPIHTIEYPTKAKRPSYSVLDKSKVIRDFDLSLRHYSEALNECISKIKNQDTL